MTAAQAYWLRMRNVFGILALGALATLGAGLQQANSRALAPRSAPSARGVPVSLAPPVRNTGVSFAEASAAEAAKQAGIAKSGMGFGESDDGLKVVAVAPAAKIADMPAPADLPAASLPQRTGARPMIAVVIDDVGLRADTNWQSVELPAPMTIAFLPYGQNLQALADAARARGHEVMVHVPMQGRDTADPGPHALRLKLAPAEIQKRLEWNLAQFTGYTGINNHMGSQFTENRDGMEVVLRETAKRKLKFLDSRTTSHSAARAVAAALAVPFAERDVFLDNHQDSSYVDVQLAQVEQLARRHGSAVAIGHPHGVTLVAVAKWAKTLDAKGFDLVTVSTVIAKRETPNWRLAADRDGGRPPG